MDTLARCRCCAHLANSREETASPQVRKHTGTYEQSEAVEQRQGGVGGSGRRRQQSRMGKALKDDA